ncbi:hypothetical protein NPIL_199641 [Nephila pilipes]|uniref:Uncharacterized protein n=1 Tax=Nephila pilipes TaxID=299642 RepID=A0A8X6NRE6_NEPPI|nr:hypothetical protein NPIL_199641 [Nephila pilipes]
MLHLRNGDDRWRQISTPRYKTIQQPPILRLGPKQRPTVTLLGYPPPLLQPPEIDEGDTRDEPPGGASNANPFPTPSLVRMNHASPKEKVEDAVIAAQI